jgi:hypothetical protein
MSLINKLSDRKIIAVIIGFGIVGLLAAGGVAQTDLIDGVTDAVGIGDSDDENDKVFDAVPERSNSVAMLDPVGLADDAVTEDVGNYVLTEELDRTNQSYSNLINQYFSSVDKSIEERLQDGNIDATLEVRDLGKVVVFSDVNSSRIEELTGNSQFESLGQETSTRTNEDLSAEEFSEIYSGVVFELDADKSEVESIYQGIQEEVDKQDTEEVTLGRSSYKDRTIYTASNENISVSFATIDSDNGYHSIGRTEVVKDTIDTYIGDMESVDTEVGENTYLSVRTSDIEAELDASQFEQLKKDATVTDIYMSYSTNGQDTAILTAEVSLQDAQNAVNYENTLQNILSKQEDRNTIIKDIDLSTEETTIILEYKQTAEEIEQGITNPLKSLSGQFGATPDSASSTVSESRNRERSSTEDSQPSVLFSQEVENSESQTYNVTATVEDLGEADFLLARTVGEAGNNFPDIKESDGPLYGLYPNQSIVSYMSEQPNELERVPSDASETRTNFVESSEQGAILVSQGDEIVVTGLNSSDRIQVAAIQNRSIFEVETYRVY